MKINYVELAVVSPALVFIAISFFNFVKFKRARKGATLRSRVLVSLFGPFLLGSSKVLDAESKGHLRKVFLFAFLFVFYLSGLLLLSS